MNDRHTHRRKPQKPVMNEHGQLVTPVSGIPAAPINWAPACGACQTRTCEDCGCENLHTMTKCKKCGGTTLSEKHQCPDTVSTGTIQSSVGTRQRVKCRVCGNNWSWTVTTKPAEANN